MRFFSVLVAVSFTLLANAQNFSSYVPECAPPCVEQTLNSSKVCASLDDNECLCTNITQILFPSIGCFTQTCNNDNLQELRSEIVSGWQNFCNASGTPANLSMGGWRPGGFETPTPSTPTSSLVTTSSSTTSSSPTSTSAIADATSPATSPDLSTGAKAGIGRKERGRSEAESTVPFNGEQPDGGLGGAEGGENQWVYKPDAEAIALSELHPHSIPPTEMPAHDIRELPVTEVPAELWHGAMPSELSADAEVPWDRNQGTARL
ncbi:hypothetical protein O1611_g6099 [Lasiodiplodia mahajangana]|uniref:Uncharacterized protein n=1 Tax=Lasiodiplodia mahajangana TaxID=1108764 RepID=A0ACC2JJ20_9PEZI|nr:hypothetical protein O1611_g6099 [Lasiodiplodia mahajangana]